MKRFTILFILALIIVLAGVIYWKYVFTYSEGTRAGLLQKFSHKGNVFKTYEGEMILSSVESNKNVSLASEKFYFSVTDPALASKLMNLEGDYISVHYLQKNGKLPWRGDTEYFVDSVVVLHPGPGY
ncbi:MAG TPA: hypothetical protein VMC08_05315 [Bacteroidales bacterium]|nr:hypothetical protein [Bacteroidales bacterium]